MKTFLKGLALLAAITSLVWIAVIWRWQATHHDVGTSDLVVYLVLLPLVLFAFALGLRWAVGAAWAKQAAAEASAASAPAQAGTPGQAGAGAETSEAKERGLAWPVLGAWVTGPAGDDIGSILEAAKAGKPAPMPDRALRDAEGLPILCARADGIDGKPIESAWGEWRLAKGGAADDTVDSSVARALAALEPLLEQAASAVGEWAEALSDEQRRVARVRVLATWPTRWADPDVAWARAWLDQQAQDRSQQVFGAKRWVVQSLPAGSGPQAWQHADSLLLTLEREQCDDLVLLLACHSDISTQAVQALDRERKLFSASQQPKGHMPGEGAAAVLLARAGRPQPAEVGAATLAWLHRPACLRRDKSIDAPGKTAADIAGRVVADAVKVAGVQAAEVAGLCCDADRHSARATELFATTIEQLPHLDAIEEMRLLGVAQGHARQTGALWAVAGAIKQAVDAERPALALSLADEHWRMALIARHSPTDAGAPIPTS